MELPASGFRWPFQPQGLKSIRIDIDPSEMRRLTPDAAVVADAQAGTSELLAAVRKVGYSKTSGRRATIREASAAALKEIQSVQPQMAYLNILREVLPQNAIVTDELSQVGFASWYGFPVYQPRTFITSGYQGTLGSGFPTALGAKVAQSRPAGGRDHRRWRLHVRRAGTGDRRAVQHRRGDAGVQQQRLRQCAARPARAVRGPRGGVRPGQSGFRQTRGILRRRRGARHLAGSFPRRAGKGAGAWRALSDRHRSAQGFGSRRRGRSFIRRSRRRLLPSSRGRRAESGVGDHASTVSELRRPPPPPLRHAQARVEGGE